MRGVTGDRRTERGTGPLNVHACTVVKGERCVVWIRVVVGAKGYSIQYSTRYRIHGARASGYKCMR